MTLLIAPLTIGLARRFVDLHHRQLSAPVSGLFAIGLRNGPEIVGAIIVGRPVARLMSDGVTAEVTRVAVLEGQRNGCSMLLGAAWKAARALGYKRMLTYTFDGLPGSSMHAVGWTAKSIVIGRQWSCPSRPRARNAEREKIRWEIVTRDYAKTLEILSTHGPLFAEVGS